MKKTLFMLAAALLMLATPSCKKGPNDPAMSLKSRKSRVANDWTMTGFFSHEKTTQTNGDWNSTQMDFDNDTKVMTTTDTAYISATSSEVITSWQLTVDSAETTFTKDGTFSKVYNTTQVWTNTVDIGGGVMETTTTTTKSTLNETGNWSFLGKAKGEYKNKERLITNTLTRSAGVQTTTVLTYSDATPTSTTVGGTALDIDNYSSGQLQATYDIDRLKSKEMIVKMTSTNNGSDDWIGSGGSTSSTPIADWVKSETITLTQSGS